MNTFEYRFEFFGMQIEGTLTYSDEEEGRMFSGYKNFKVYIYDEQKELIESVLIYDLIIKDETTYNLVMDKISNEIFDSAVGRY
jgi:hypothetical protein